MTAEEQVAQGVALLDSINPGWRQKINLTTFRISSGTYCILGQLYGDFDEGLILLTKADQDKTFSEEDLNDFAKQHGFWTNYLNWPGLQAAWVAELEGAEKLEPVLE